MTSIRDKVNIDSMKKSYLKLAKCKGKRSIVLGMAMFIASFIAGNAQDIVGYQYVSKIGGHIVSAQDTLKVLPGQEIEYVVELHSVGGVNISPILSVNIPFYANYYDVDTTYYQGVSGVGLMHLGNLIVWDISGAQPPSAGLFAKLTLTLVASHDCYALNATSCDREITVTGGITTSAVGDYLYGYPPPSVLTPSSTPTVVEIDAAAFLVTCLSNGKDYRQFVYLEDNSGVTIPISDVSPYFPAGALFYDTIDEVNNIALGSSVEYTAMNGFPKTAGKDAYYALLTGTCWHKFYINVLDTTDITFCAGETLENAVVWVSDWDEIIDNSGKWRLGVDSINPLTKILTLADSGKTLRYEAVALCGNSQLLSNGVIINVHDAPEITDTTYLLSYCVGYNITASAVVDPHGAPVTYAWTLDGTPIGGDSAVLNDYVLDLSDHGKTLRLIVTNSCGADTADIIVNVLSSPIVLTCPASTNYADIPTDHDLCTAVVNYLSDIDLGGGTNESYTYQFTGATSGSGTGSGSGEAFNLGTTTVKIIAYNDCSIDSCTFDITVNDHQAPYISCKANVGKSPVSGENYYIASGTEFDATATDNCTGAVILYHNVVQAGMTDTTTLDGYKFYLGKTTVMWVAEDAAGNKDTCYFDVTVGTTPIIVAYPDTAICGDDGVVRLLVVSPEPSLGFATYQWYEGTTPLAGETDSVLFVNTAGTYSCELTYTVSSTSEFSNSIIVTKTSPVAQVKPNLLSIPASGTICTVDGQVYLYVENTSDYVNPVFMWYTGNVAIANTESYYYAPAAGAYHVVVVEGSCAYMSDTITVTTTSTPIDAPVISSIVVDTAICSNDGMVILQVTSTHTGTSIHYTWFKDNVIIPNNDRPIYEAIDSGYYKVMIEIDGCAAESAPVKVTKPASAGTINAPTLDVIPSVAEICVGGAVYIKVNNIADYTTPTFIWFRNDTVCAGLTDSFALITEAGNYFVVVVDGGCVSRSIDVNVTNGVNTITKPNVVSHPVSQEICGTNGVVVLELTNGSVFGSTVSYQWYDGNAVVVGATSTVYSAFDEGDYYLVVTTGGCVAVSDTFYVRKNASAIAKPLVSMSPSNGMISVGLSTATLTLTNTTDYTSPDYQWYKDGLPITGETNAAYVANDPGWYQLLVVENNSCASWSDTFYVTSTSCIIPLPILTVIPSDGQACQPYGSVLIQLANLSSYTNPTFEWYLNDVLLPGDTNPTIEVTTAGAYRIRVTADISSSNPNRCDLFSNPDTVTITAGSFTAKPLIVRSPAGGEICDNAGSVLLTFSNLSAFPSGISYYWVKDGYETADTGTVILVTDTGDYQVLVIDGACATLSTIEHITNSSTSIEKPNLVSASGAIDLCDGSGSLTLRVTNGSDYSSGVAFQWYKNGAALAGETNNSYIATDSGIYWVHVIDGLCSSASDSITITISGSGNITQPTLSKQPDVTDICSGGEVMYTVDNASAYSSTAIYIWFKDTGIVKTGADDFYKATEGGIYWVQVVDGCNSVSAKDTLNGGTGTAVRPDITSASGGTNICLPDGVIVLELVNTWDYTNRASYQWYKDDIAILGANTPIYIATDSGEYKLMVTDGCSAMSDSIKVTKDGSGNILKPILSDTGAILCTGGNMLLSVTNTGDYSSNARYIWYDDVTKLQDSTLSVYQIDTAGMYWVLVVDGGCASVSDRDTITMSPSSAIEPQITALPQSLTICGNRGVVILRLTNASAYTNPTYQWYKDNQLIAGETRGIYEATDSGSYRIAVTDGPCIAFSTSIDVDKDMNDDIERPVMMSQPNTTDLCVGGSILLVVSNTLDYSANVRYVWYRNDDIVQDSTLPYYEIKQDGIYFVQVIDGNCSSRSNWNDTITMVPSSIVQPVISTIPSNNNICGANGTVFLILNNASSYASPSIQWYKDNAPILGATGTTYEAHDTGYYRVRVIEAGGCTVLSDTVIKVTNVMSTIEKPDVQTIPLSNNVCGDTGVVFLYVDNTYDYTNPTYQWYNGDVAIIGATQSYYSATDSGLYRVFVVDGGCSVFSDTVAVTKSNTVINQPIIVSSTGGKIYGGNNVKLWLDNEQMFGSPLLYYWYRTNDMTLISTDSVAVTNVAGSYRLLLVDGSCAAWSNIIILVDTACNLPSLSVSNTSICDSTSIDLALTVTMITPNGIVKYYADNAGQFELGSSVVSPSSTRNYYLQVLDTISGCRSAIVPVTITIVSQPALPNAVADMIYKNGDIVPSFTFTTQPGVIAVWAWVEGDTIVGLPWSGATTIQGFTAVNNTDSVIKATYMYTSDIVSGSMKCNANDTGYFNIEILPTPDVDFDSLTVINQEICSGDTINPVKFIGRVSGTVFSWMRTGILGPPSGTGDLQDIVLVNTSGAPITLIYQVTPTYTYRGVTSTGTPKQFTITVNPAPAMDNVPSFEYCAGAVAPIYPFTPGGLSYSWNRVGGDPVGLANSGTGSLSSFTAVNQTDTVRTAIYEVTGRVGSLVSCFARETFTISVYPQPIVDQVEDIELCNGDSLSVLFTGVGSQYRWQRTSGNIPGIPPSGTGDMQIASLTNTTQDVLTASYRVTAEYVHSSGVCTSSDVYFNISVAPTPVLNSITHAGIICSGDNFTYMATSPTQKITYSWRRVADPNINGGNSSSGQTQSINEVLTNTSDTMIRVTYEIILTINGCSETYPVTVDVNPEIGIDIDYINIVCSEDAFVLIPYTTTSTAGMNYRITFSSDAKSVGFSDITTPTALPASPLQILMPTNIVAAGDYAGVIHIQVGNCVKDIPFAIRVSKPTQITVQPSSALTLCDSEDNIFLSVSATGENLTYQWYFEGVAIPGATDSVYEYPFTYDLEGKYYVEVTGDCGSVLSVEIEVSASPNRIQEKWDDVLYIANSDGLFVKYQWYKNGNALTTDANSQYYTDPHGFVGTYKVRAYFADGTYIESCPLTLNRAKTHKMVLFPNPVRSGEIYTILLEGDYLEDATIEIYDVLGKFLESHVMTGDRIELRAWYAAGSYSIRIITKEQGIKIKKLIVE